MGPQRRGSYRMIGLATGVISKVGQSGSTEAWLPDGEDVIGVATKCLAVMRLAGFALTCFRLHDDHTDPSVALSLQAWQLQ